MSPKKNGVGLLDMFMQDKLPYKLWDADLWACRKCGTEIVIGFSDVPVSRHEDETMQSEIDRYIRISRLIKCYEKSEDSGKCLIYEEDS